MEAGTQFIGVKPGINMQERKSNVANNPTDVFTIEEIRGGYQSFVGYFTVETIIVSYESLTVGDTYLIVVNDGGSDFMGVGAPDNHVGTEFVATGADPNWGDPYGVLINLSQSKFEITPNFNSLGFDLHLTANLLEIPTKTIVGINFPYAVDYNKIFVNLPSFNNKFLSYYVNDYADILITDGYPTISGNVYNYPIEIRVYE